MTGFIALKRLSSPRPEDWVESKTSLGCVASTNLPGLQGESLSPK